jgi:hypothetical protein
VPRRAQVNAIARHSGAEQGDEWLSGNCIRCRSSSIAARRLPGTLRLGYSRVYRTRRCPFRHRSRATTSFDLTPAGDAATGAHRDRINPQPMKASALPWLPNDNQRLAPKQNPARKSRQPHIHLGQGRLGKFATSVSAYLRTTNR